MSIRNRQNFANIQGLRDRSVYSKTGTNKSFSVALNEPFKNTNEMLNVNCKQKIMKRCIEKKPGSMDTSTDPTCWNKAIEQQFHDLNFAQDFKVYLKAFALIYVLPEEQWKAEFIEILMREDVELFESSTDKDQASEQQQKVANTCNIMDGTIKHKFKLEGYSFTIELRPPYWGGAKIPANRHIPYIIKDLRSILKEFFSVAHYCVFLHKTGNLLIWRRAPSYFLMKIDNRHREDPTINKEQSKQIQMLLCLQSLDNVVYLISNLSGVSSKDEFSIRELAVVHLVTPDGRAYCRESSKRHDEYNVINKSYAYLKSTLHLSLNSEDTLRNGSSILVGVAAILASKIDNPTSWNTNMFDRLICYGVELCRSCWGDNVKKHSIVDLDTFPTQMRLGQFVVELKLLPRAFTGKWQCNVSLQNNNFDHELRQAMINYGNALFQINKQVYAIWYKDNYYYLLDPYRHTVITSKAREDAKYATVRMFHNMATMLSVFHQLLRESNKNSNFYIHVVCIKNIAECPQGYALQPIVDTDSEVLSLNETIIFPKRYLSCEHILKDTSCDKSSSSNDEKRALEHMLRNDDRLEQFENVGNNDYLAKPNTVKSKNPKSVVNRRTVHRSKSPMRKMPAHKRSKVTISVNNKWNLPYGEAKMNITTATPMPTKKKIDSKCPCKSQDEIGATSKSSPPATNVRVTGGANFATIAIQTTKPNAKSTKSPPNMKCNVSSQTSYKTADHTNIKSNDYPVYTKYPHHLAVVGSESGTVESLTRLLNSAFKVSNRVLTMTPWGNYVVFRQRDKRSPPLNSSQTFYLFTGCTCNMDRFRHLDLSFGTAGLIPFEKLSELICYMIDSRESRALNMLSHRLDEPCRKYEEILSRGA